MPNLNSNIDLDFKKFLRWWGRELSFLVPDKIRQLVADKQGVIVVRSADERLELNYRDDRHTKLLGSFDRSDEGIARFRELLASDERLAKARVILRLNRHEGIAKLLSLPAAAKENLYQVVSYELSKYTPFNPAQVYYAVKPLPTDPEPGQIKVLLVLTPRESLDTLYEDAKSMGVAPQLAEYESAENDSDSDDEYNLLPEGLRPVVDKMPRLVYSGLTAAVLLLLAAVIGMPLWFENQSVNLIHEKIREIEKSARNTKELQSEIDSVIGETRAIIEMKNSVPPILDMLNSLSTLIKDDTWLFYAQYADGHLQIQGESPSASGLIAVLEDSELFANAKFASPVTQDTTTGFERFQITVDVTKAGEGDDQDQK